MPAKTATFHLPAAASAEEEKHRGAIDELLRNRGYWEEGDGFSIPPEEEDYVDSVGRRLNDGMLLRDQSAADILGVLGVAGVTEEEEGIGRGPSAGVWDDVAGSVGNPRPSTYGEITILGARQLFRRMGMAAIAEAMHPVDGAQDEDKDGGVVFYDLGSGAGRLVVQAYLELPRLTKAVGIELAPARHGAAVWAWKGLTASGEAELVRGMGMDASGESKDGGCVGGVSSSILELRQGDLFADDISDATHIYASSLCFTDGMMAKLAVKLDADAAPRLRCVASLKQFPPGALFGITSPHSEFVEMTWTKNRDKGCSVYFYERKAEDVSS